MPIGTHLIETPRIVPARVVNIGGTTVDPKSYLLFEDGSSFLLFESDGVSRLILESSV